MLKSTRALLLVAALFCGSIHLQSQTMVWRTRFPVPEGYTHRDYGRPSFEIPIEPVDTNKVEKLINFLNVSAGDGAGGSVWAGSFSDSRNLGSTTNYPNGDDYWGETVTRYAGTNNLRVLWVNRNGRRIFTNDMRFEGILSETNSFSSHGSYPYAQINFLRCTTNAVHFQVTTSETNFIRRITKVNSTFYVKTTPLRKGEVMFGNARPVSDQFGFTSFLFASNQITRFSIK